MYVLSLMDPAKLPRFVLLVVPEPMTRTVDYTDRASAVLWGDGALAAVFSTRDRRAARSIIGSALAVDPAGHDKVVDARASAISMQEGRTVQTFAIRKTVATAIEALRRARRQRGPAPSTSSATRPTAACSRSVCERCDVPEERHHSNCEFFGNTAGAGSGSVISHALGRLDGRRTTSPSSASAPG